MEYTFNEALLNAKEFGYDFLFKNNLLIEISQSVQVICKISNKRTVLEFMFTNNQNLNCPFSLLLFLETPRKVSFYFGNPTTSILQYDVVDDVLDEDSTNELIATFLNSIIVEQKTFCRNKLKKIDYIVVDFKFEGSNFIPYFTGLNNMPIVCFNKQIESKEYQSWL